MSDLWNGYDLEWVRLRELGVDTEYQRKFKMPFAESIKANFSPRAFGVAVVSERVDGSKWLIDGQQRCGALRLMGDEDILVPCVVHRGLVREEEAKFFLELNDSKNMTILEKFKARLLSGDPIAVDINDIAKNRGLRIAGGSLRGTICCVSACESIYMGSSFAAKGPRPRALALTFDIIGDVWEHSAASLVGSIIEGLGLVVSTYGSKIDQERIVLALRRDFPKDGSGAAGLRSLAEQWKEVHSCGIPTAVACCVVNSYNKRLTTQKLAPYRDLT